MLKFNTENQRVFIDPLTITLSSLQEIWVSDPSPMKEEATKFLTYIHICSQIDSTAPFFNADPTEVSFLARKEIFGDMSHSFKPPFDDEFLNLAIGEYQYAFETVEEAAARAYNKKIHQIKQLIEKTEVAIHENTVKGEKTYTSNFPILSKMMLDMQKIFESKKILEENIRADKAKAGTIRGDKKLSFIERQQEEMEKARRKAGSSSEVEEPYF